MNDILLLTGIVFALSFLLSVKFNRRRTEDSTHPVWSLILIQLCGSNLGRLQPVPQYRLYFSAVDFTDLDPNETISGSDVEVIPDFCILLHRAVLVRVVGPLRPLLANIQSTYLPSRAIKITSTFIPLLVELKRPVSRHCRDIDEFMSGLGTMMNSAQSQAEGQAHCLFSIPNYHRQMHVVLLAAVGEWWSFRFVPRSNFGGKTFNGNKYVFDVNDRLKEEERNNPLEEDEAKLMDPDLIHEMRNLIAHAGETPAQIKDRHDAERDARQRRRAQRNMRRSACDADWKLRWKFQREFMESELGSRVALEDRADWSGVMRLGSKTSEYYLFQIRNYLNQFARDNVEEDDISQ
ncbi:hypothetical protein C8R41DRAFT_864685 [Lentinula lateritia]|uniref:Uncharacterized protein n=1 Tax=Lentinula lateritia TaxID=40482 RepID=A0ABQ8VS99_9AGAR|nr:hypothetical protein C8R41DRAFT_864685 [Lentinula lateritia]